MWILPKQLHISAFVADTKALDLDSEEFSQICEKSLTWRGKDSLSRTWLQRWKRENWMQHLSSRTLRPSHTERFEDAWTFSLEVSRANPLVLLESVKQLKTPDISSPTSQTESESANLELFSLKTYKGSSPARQQTESQFSNMSSESWKDWVTEQRQEYSQRKKSAHLIRESESSSWPTPTAVNRVRDEETMEKCLKFRQSNGQTSVPLYLEEKVIREPQNWPTATTRDWKDTNATVPPSRANPSKQTLGQRVAHVGLQDQANLNTNGKSQESWSTPQARDWKGAEGRAYKGQTKDLPAQTQAMGKLNPDWVEHLMGLPVGWTDLGSWETE
jgi:hypothetical protein